MNKSNAMPHSVGAFLKGVGIADVKLDSNNHLLVYLDNGKILDAGQVPASDDALDATSERPVQNKIITAELDRIVNTLLAEAVRDITTLQQTKVDKISGKGLSTKDFTSAHEARLNSLHNYDDTTLRAELTALSNRLTALVGGNANEAINSFNEIIAFLKGVEDSDSLNGILAGIGTRIAAAEARITAVEVKQREIEGAIADYDAQIESLDGRVEAQYNEINLVKGNQQTASVQISALQQRVNVAEDDIDSLEIKTATNAGSIASLTNRLSKAEALTRKVEDGSVVVENTLSEVTEDGAKPVSGAAVSKYIAGITHDAETEQSIRILLIGSSLGMNTIGQFPMIAQYSGVKCIVGNVYQGSLTLQQIAEYCENGNQINGRYSKWNLDSNKWVHSPSNMSSVLTDEKWDYIILQNSNAEAEEWTDTQEVALKTIVDYITSLDGQPTIVFNTNCANSLGAGNAATREAQVATTERINKVCEVVRNRWGFDILPLASVIQHCRGNDTLTALGKWKNGDLAQDSVHLDYGVGMYAAACMCYNFFLKRFGKSVLTNDYLPTIDQLQNFAGTGVTDLADRFTPITEEIGALIRKEVSAAMVSTSSKQEVNKVYEAAGAVYNSETEMWEMNGITDLTDRDMANIVTFGNFCGLTTIAGHFANAKCRTNIRHVNSYSTLSISANSFRSSKFEVIDVRSTYEAFMTKLIGATNVFLDCQKLKSVLGKLDVSAITAFTNAFNLCKALTDIQLHGLKCNVEFPASPLSVASGIYMIENASTTENITIKVMASVYSAWMADSTIAQLLTDKTNITLVSL